MATDVYTLARPYAEAAFGAAGDADERAAWSSALEALSAIVSNDDVASVIASPVIDDKQLADAIIDIGGDDFDTAHANFVRLLVDNGRLSIAPAIAELYERQRAVAENRIDVEVTSAKALTKKQQTALSRGLSKRFDREVDLSFVEDDSIIGGLIIRAGDEVIDGSITAQLTRMRQRLAH